jgi:hypothetical protein
MKLTIPHRYRFDRPYDLGRRDAWDDLRLHGSGPFLLPEDRTAWTDLSGDPIAVARARALHELLPGGSVASYGAGIAATERALYTLDPSRRLVLTDFAPGTTARLSRLFPEATVIEHDLRSDAPVPNIDLHMFLRVDTELDDTAFRTTLRRFGGQRVLVAATEVLSVRALVRETRTWLRGGAVHAGQVRSRGAFEALFARTHESRPIRVGDLHAWLLEPRR